MLCMCVYDFFLCKSESKSEETEYFTVMHKEAFLLYVNLCNLQKHYGINLRLFRLMLSLGRNIFGHIKVIPKHMCDKQFPKSSWHQKLVT